MRTKWGQNFLIDPNWQKKIVDRFEPRGKIAEIGPGKGALTQHLKERYQDFFVFEIDPELFEFHETEARYRLIKGSFLDWNFEIDDQRASDMDFIGNLPYETGSAMISRLVRNRDVAQSFLFLLQKEVVDRLVAKPSTKSRGFLSLFVQSAFEVEALDRVPRGAFDPPPEVESQLVFGRRRPKATHPPRWEAFLKEIFSSRRKTLKNNLLRSFDRSVIDKIEKIDLSRRAESLHLEEALCLFRELNDEQERQ